MASFGQPIHALGKACYATFLADAVHQSLYCRLQADQRSRLRETAWKQREPSSEDCWHHGTLLIRHLGSSNRKIMHDAFMEAGTRLMLRSDQRRSAMADARGHVLDTMLLASTYSPQTQACACTRALVL